MITKLNLIKQLFEEFKVFITLKYAVSGHTSAQEILNNPSTNY